MNILKTKGQMDTTCVRGYLSYHMSHGNTSRGKNIFEIRMVSWMGCVCRPLQRRVKAAASGDVIRKTRLIVYVLFVLRYNNSVTHTHARTHARARACIDSNLN